MLQKLLCTLLTTLLSHSLTNSFRNTLKLLPPLHDGAKLLRTRKSAPNATALLLALHNPDSPEAVTAGRCLAIALVVEGLKSMVVGNISIVAAAMLLGTDFEKTEFLLFDDPNQPLSYEVIPPLNGNCSSLGLWLNDRHAQKVVFATKSPIELRWAHARGNFELVALGDHSKPLILLPNRPVMQYTTSGHLFAFLHPSPDGNAPHDRMAIDRVVAFYLVAPTAPTSDGIRFTFEESSVTCASTVAHSNVVWCGCEDCDRYLKEYWAGQRHSQVWVNPWALPPLTPPLPPPPPQSLSSSLVEYSVAKPWMIFNLSRDLADSLSRSHRRSRQRRAEVETMISTVFNQDVVDTHYVPLNRALLDALTDTVVEQTSLWLGVEPQHWDVTGSYGVREYQKGAVINWHVDPTESQPITAIAHIAHSSSDCDCETFHSDTGETRHSPPTGETCHSEEDDGDLVGVGGDTRCGGSDWELQIARLQEDAVAGVEADEWDRVVLREGEVLVLESARVPHARVHPLMGQWYANAFVHLAPLGWAQRVQHIPS